MLKQILMIFSLSVFSNIAFASEYYFGYGSNLSHPFMCERLKDGKWIDDYHKDGKLQGSAPEDLGGFYLDDYEFSYSLDLTAFAETGTAANVIAKKGSRTFGVLYKISKAQLKELDKSEDTPVAYQRLAIKVHRLPTVVGSGKATQKNFSSKVAWVYVGQKKHLTQNYNPDKDYVSIILSGAREHGLPASYVQQFLDYKPKQTDKSSNEPIKNIKVPKL
jgi:hypothetical protein